MQSHQYRSYIIVFCATIVRYYDYGLFGLSASVLSKHFMPQAESKDQILTFFGLFSLTMLVRPIGAIIFGKIGDKFGRITSLKISMTIAALSTGLIAIIPDYDVCGAWSVALLLLCRLLFLVSLAGEVDGIKIYISEMLGKNRRNLGVGMVNFSSQMGVLLASVMYYISLSLDGREWLWRGNFLFGGILGLLIILMRKYMQESEVFLRNKSSSGAGSNSSIISIILENKLKFLFAIIVHGLIGGVYYFLIIFWGVFAGNIADIPSPYSATFDSISIIVLYSIACVLSGFLADKYHAFFQSIIALICSIICVIFMEIMFKASISNYHLHYVLAFLAPFFTVPSFVKMQSLFAIDVRMRMCSLSHSLGSMIFSSTTPFMCMLIYRSQENIMFVLGYFLLQLVTLFFLLMIIRKKNYVSYV